MNTGPMTRQELALALEGPDPMISGAPDPELQLQPNGFDVTLSYVRTLRNDGIISKDPHKPILPASRELKPDRRGFYRLHPSECYIVGFNEIVRLPPDVTAAAYPRSTLLRCGAAIHAAVWDAGYAGRSQTLLTVHNPHGILLEKDARIVQMTFFRMREKTESPYSGSYQNEGLR